MALAERSERLEARHPETFRVLVVDDHPVVAEGVAALVRASAVKVVGAADTAERACQQARELQPDVVLLDMRLGGVLGSTVVPALLAAAPQSRVLVFTAFPEHPAARSALAAGASGCVVKDTGRTDLVEAITEVAKAPLPVPGRADANLEFDLGRGLSTREQEILCRVARGRTNSEIAGELFLAPTTVKTYWQHALRKLGARNRAEAIARAYDLGLL